MLVFGDELLTAGTPGDGRVRDSLGPQVPGWLNRLLPNITIEPPHDDGEAGIPVVVERPGEA